MCVVRKVNIESRMMCVVRKVNIESRNKYEYKDTK